MHDLIHEEETPLFNAATYSHEDAADERGYTLDEVDVSEEWFRPRVLSEAEQADEMVQTMFNPDWAEGDAPTTVEYLACAPDHADAVRFLRVTAKSREQKS